ncbi:TolC family protein [Ochrobactrum daejeonense]|nr:TolC family protein [Brucella daejeonensis]
MFGLPIAGCSDTLSSVQPSVPKPVAVAKKSEPAKEDHALRPNPVKGNRIGLADAVTMIIKRHPDLKQATAVLARSKADVGAARSVWYPQLTYQAGVGPSMFSDGDSSRFNDGAQGPGVALNQQIWDFGRSAGAIDSARAAENQRSQEVIVTADKLAEKGALAFLDVKRYEALAAEAVKNSAALKDLRGRIQDRVLAGTSDRSDLMLADVRIEGARGEEIQAQTSLMAAKVLLATLIGGMPEKYNDPTPVISKLPLYNTEPEFDQLPAVIAADQAEKASAAKIRETKAEIFPRVGVQVGYNRNYFSNNNNSGQDDNYTALLTVTGDLYKPGHKYAVQAAEEDRRAAEAMKASAILDIRGRARQARENLIGGKMRIAAYQQQEKTPKRRVRYSSRLIRSASAH